MSVISNEIGRQSFELIRDQIGAILYDELDGQYLQSYDPLMQARVYLERFVPFNQSELPCINITLGNVNFESKTPIESDGVNMFFIDVYTKATAAPGDQPDTGAYAQKQMHKLVGVCRAILEDARYSTLGFEAPFIGHRRISGIKFADPETKDTVSVAKGRITMIVKANEENGSTTPRLLAEFQTVVKINESDSGYMYFGTAIGSEGFDYVLDFIIPEDLPE
jgi:hypothetical protein